MCANFGSRNYKLSDETLNTYQDTFLAVANTKEDEKAKYQCTSAP
jgi:hypothetical protein